MIFRVIKLLFAISAFVSLVACSEMRVRDRAQDALLIGDYEDAIQTLEEGIRRYPDSTLLRARLVQARAEVLAQVLTKASTLRATGRVDEADKALHRAKALDPQNQRIEILLAELDAERRQVKALTEATQLFEQKKTDKALLTVTQALQDNPRHEGLRTLMRKIELAQKQAQFKMAQIALSETRPISLDFRDAPLRNVLDMISRNSGINFVLDKDLRNDSRVTVFMRQAQVEDVLDLIISTNQLAKKVIDDKTIVIYPNTPDKQREYQEQIVRVFYLTSAEAQGASSFLKTMLKIRDPFVNERSNMLALRDSPENIELAERLLNLYDTGEPEVLLEVEVMEVSSSRLTELGVKYPDTFSLTPLAPPGATGLTLDNIRDLGRDRIAVGVSGLIVNLKKQIGDATTLANPKIRARNKEKAKILIGDKIPVITTTTGNAGFVSDTVNYLDVGLKLEVEPTVYPDDDVAIKVALEVSSLGTSVKTASGTLAYQIGTRNASTLLRLRDGETQLLAGLISKDDRTSSNKVPGLGDFPILGRLFGSQADNSTRTELVLAITPRILRNIRRPDASDSELWVGTESLPRLRAPGGFSRIRAQVDPGEAQKPQPDTKKSAEPEATESGSAPSQLQQPKPNGPATPILKWEGAQDARQGESVELQLTIDSGTSMRGLPIQLEYDKDKLQLTDLFEGDFLRRDGAPTTFTKSIDTGSGVAAVGVLRAPSSGVAGKGQVFSIRFKTLKAGDAMVKITRAAPMGLEAELPAPIVLPTLTIKVQ